MSKKYTLVTIEDLLLIPKDRFDDFVVDLKQFHSAAQATKNMIDAIAHVTGEEQPTEAITMVWTDDGKHTGKVIIKSTHPKAKESSE